MPGRPNVGRMGDARFEQPLDRVRVAPDRVRAVAGLDYEDLVLALAAASREREPYMANVLATELLNRSRRGTARVLSSGLGMGAALILLLLGIAALSSHPHNVEDHLFLLVGFLALAAGAVGARLVYPRALARLMERKRA